MVSAVYEYVHLCRFYGICDGESAVVGISSIVGISACTDGQCKTSLLWNLHAG